MLTDFELKITFYAVGTLLAANILAMLLFVLFAKLPDGKLRESIRDIICELDKFADNMENEMKRQRAIDQINSILGWKKILVPAALIGWVIDAEVSTIRKMQKASGVNCDYNKEE